ncbi:MAG: DNA polymerase III subunit beta [Thalassolituus sp.]
MKIITDKKTCQQAIKSAAKLAKRGTMPILEGVAVEFDGSVCRITANDLERTYSETFPAEGEPGRCVLPAAKLVQVINAAKGEIIITEDLIKAGRSRVKLQPLPYDDYPQPDYAEGQLVSVGAEQIASAVKNIVHAMPTKDSRHYLNGILLRDGFAVAANGPCMAFAECGYDGPEVIIPAGAIPTLVDMAGEVRVSERQLIVDGPGYRFSTSLIDGNYPDWTKLVPTEFSSEITANAEDLIDACKVAALGDDLYKKGSVSAADGQLTIENTGATSGCDCEYSGNVEIAFNLQYLIGAIEAEGGESVTIKMTAPNKAAMVGRYNVVMPVKV